MLFLMQDIVVRVRFNISVQATFLFTFSVFGNEYFSTLLMCFIIQNYGR